MIQPLLKTEAKTAAMQPFSRPTKGNRDENQALPPLPPWTPGHRLTIMTRRPDPLMTYDLTIRCPSSWTPDHRMNAISPIPAISYDELPGVQAWTLEASEV